MMIRRWTHQYEPTLEEHEPTLEDLLAEPIIRQIMASDGQKADDIRRLFKEAEMRNRFASCTPRLVVGWNVDRANGTELQAGE